MPGTAASIASMVTAPEVYPDCVPVAAAPAIVPPVARMTMLGLLCCADRSVRSLRERSNDGE